jgi:GAF domain-containing protein
MASSLTTFRANQQTAIGIVHEIGITAEEVYLTQRDPVALSAVALGGIRTLLGVPLLNKGEMIGAFFLSRREVRPFHR